MTLPRPLPPGPGGSEGGCAPFLLGLVMAVAGGYLLLEQVQVVGGGFRIWGYSGFGLSLVPLLAGIGWLFWNGRSVGGWLLVLCGAVIIAAGILAHLDLWFRPTSLFNTLMMLGLLAGGFGLMARGLRPPPPRPGG